MTTIVFDMRSVTALTLIGRAVRACRRVDFLKNQIDFSENIKAIADWLADEANGCKNTISAEELDGYDLENDVDFS